MRQQRVGLRLRHFLITAAAVLPFGTAHAQTACMPGSSVVCLEQGTAWASVRETFYSQDQGSQMIPLAWLTAIKAPNGQPFLFDQLQRYGYLVNPYGTNAGLPIGFTVSGPQGSEVAGMTCAACHTRDIQANGTTYRVDGGPALSDFQSFLTDMVDGVGNVLTHDDAWKAFSADVLGSGATAGDITDLRKNVQLWYDRENALKTLGYPAGKVAWGRGRLDAVSMIFNRLTGMDLGTAPSYLIPQNIQLADAQVRYPFLWNAPVQDFTQWPGFAANGNDLLGLSRNLGEVYGVFGIYHPVKSWWRLGGYDFLAGNSANFDGLNALEGMIKQIGAPKWPWKIDENLAKQGEAVWQKPSLDNKSCADCHDQKRGEFRSFNHSTWATPIINVGTDTREWGILGHSAQSGVLKGGQFLWFGQPISAVDSAFGLLGFSVIGSIIQKYTSFSTPASDAASARAASATLPSRFSDLAGAFSSTVRSQQKPTNAYESRVLYGIWAAAPYLHNGSVPTLADLLMTSSERPKSFHMGTAYDTDKVGILADQGGTDVITTTGCEAINSGNSRCGHEYGTEFSPAEKRALLEFMKGL
jgi:hypothetical protein